MYNMEDRDCGENLYTTCDVKVIPEFTLQNSAELNQIIDLEQMDPRFLVKFGLSDPDKFILKSFSGHVIGRKGRKKWHLWDMYQKVIMNLTSHDLPTGLQRWTYKVGNNKEVIELNINACNSSEFGCDDGSCMERFIRCNQISDCRNGEDEVDCFLVDIPTGYNNLVPVATNNDELAVSINITLLKILKMDTMDSTFTLQFEMITQWSDHRLRYSNLQSTVNVVHHKEWQNIWTPNFIMKPTKHYDMTSTMNHELHSLILLKMYDDSKYYSEYRKSRNNFIYSGQNVNIRKENRKID